LPACYAAPLKPSGAGKRRPRSAKLTMPAAEFKRLVQRLDRLRGRLCAIAEIDAVPAGQAGKGDPERA
jgi:hypothetical protein